MSITACHNCQKGVGDWCIPCKRISQDDIRIQHTPKNKDEYTISRAQPKSEKVTPFSEETENALRILLASFAQLPTTTIVIFHCLLRGMTITETARLLGESRAFVFVHIKNDTEKWPWLDVVYRTGRKIGFKKQTQGYTGKRLNLGRLFEAE